jgi:CheY-like chemotaxis protein
MSELVILCVEDEAEVRAALMRDLQTFASIARIEEAEDADDARAVVRENLAKGRRLALVLCDHQMPGRTGVDLLIELQKDPATAPARKLLVTGQAGLQDTIRAVNEANLHHYIAKPWKGEQIIEAVRQQLTEYVLAHEDDLMRYVSVLDGPRLLAAMRNRAADR